MSFATRFGRLKATSERILNRAMDIGHRFITATPMSATCLVAVWYYRPTVWQAALLMGFPFSKHLCRNGFF